MGTTGSTPSHCSISWPPVSPNGGYYRRSFGNQTFTDDLRYDASSYNSFCLTVPVDPNLPDGGGYQVCGVQDLKPSVFALNLPANSLIRSTNDFGGVTNMYHGFDVNVEKRFSGGSFLRGGINAQARNYNECNLLAAGLDAVVTAAAQGTETYPDGSSQCDRHYPFRPDAKISGFYPLPWDFVLSGTYQFSRGVQTGGAGPSTVARQLFGGVDPVGQWIRVRRVPFTVIGVLDQKGQRMMGTGQDDLVLMPISTARAKTPA